MTEQTSSKTMKYLKKKNGTIVGPGLKDIKKQDHPFILQALGRLEQLDNDDFSQWYTSAFANGFNAQAQAHFLCDGLRYFGIFDSLAYDRFGTTCNYCMPAGSLFNLLDQNAYSVLEDITTDSATSVEMFGQKWNKSTDFSGESVGVVIYTSLTDKRLLGILQTHKNKFDQWRKDPAVANAEAQGWKLKAPTLLCLVPPAGSKIKDAPEKVKEAMLALNVGWTEDTDFRLAPASFVKLLSDMGEKICEDGE